MRVGIIGTGAIAHKHAHAYRNIGYSVTACTDISAESGHAFADQYGCTFLPDYQDLCRHPDVDYVDVCTFPDFRLQPLRICAEERKSIQVQKPIATDVATAREMVDIAAGAGIQLGVVSQHRFDDSVQFLREALDHGRLGKILEADAYVKWYRTPEYYSRPIKGSWAVEGGGALINQAIHQVDVLLYLAGRITEVFGYWQLAAAHNIESEDIVSALFKYGSGATGVVQASTAFRPGYTERLELHGTHGTAVISGDKLTAWDVEHDSGAPPPIDLSVASGASDPMAISLTPFERQFADFGDAIRTGRKPLSSGEDGLRALQVVTSVYESCRKGAPVPLSD